jgi:hypothetical protein
LFTYASCCDDGGKIDSTPPNLACQQFSQSAIQPKQNLRILQISRWWWIVFYSALFATFLASVTAVLCRRREVTARLFSAARSDSTPPRFARRGSKTNCLKRFVFWRGWFEARRWSNGGIAPFESNSLWIGFEIWQAGVIHKN